MRALRSQKRSLSDDLRARDFGQHATLAALSGLVYRTTVRLRYIEKRSVGFNDSATRQQPEKDRWRTSPCVLNDGLVFQMGKFVF